MQLSYITTHGWTDALSHSVPGNTPLIYNHLNRSRIPSPPNLFGIWTRFQLTKQCPRLPSSEPCQRKFLQILIRNLNALLNLNNLILTASVYICASGKNGTISMPY
jgi:hypothetical protein